ncbi:MAG: undecaprenyl-phosphate glucose phosphotransferase [Xanthobacteraceae bacterium]|nr:undecaprenyl-phosphate glucose phosphotransferase [Xanthobacteraceae bacterium]
MSITTYGAESIDSGYMGRIAPIPRPFQILLGLSDFLVIVSCYWIASICYDWFMDVPIAEADLAGGVGMIVGAVFVVVGYFQSVYVSHHLLKTTWQLRKVALNWMVSLALLALLAFLLKSTANLSRGTIVLFAGIGIVSLSGYRALWRIGLASAIARGLFLNRKVVLLSLKPLDFTSNRFKDLRKNGFDVVGHYVLGSEPDSATWDRDIQDIVGRARASNVDEYLLAIDWNELNVLQKLSQRLRMVPQPIRLLPDFTVADLVARPFFPVSGTMAIEIQRPPLNLFERAQKRFLDVGLASIALFMLAPLMATVAILIRLDSPGNVIFRQSRRGFNGKPFDICKFRSMYVAENGNTITQATRQDARVTPIGRILRRTSIDELPQLWNVLRGEMSLVGPRPHALAHDNYYDKVIEKYVFRHHMKPGLTGWAQVNGFRGETPTIDLMEKRVEYDVWYVSNWSIWLDIRIILRTAVALMYQEAY